MYYSFDSFAKSQNPIVTKSDNHSSLYLQQPEDVRPARVGGAEAAEVVRPVTKRPPDGLAEAAAAAQEPGAGGGAAADGGQDQGLDGNLEGERLDFAKQSDVTISTLSYVIIFT